MNWRFFVACGVIVAALAVLIVSAVSSSAKAVVTVLELNREATRRDNIRVGARVTADPIQASGGERPTVRFVVRDIPPKGASESANGGKPLSVVYQGLMPDTLKADRDVILEGSYDGEIFRAKNLMTQCPSKYEPPTPENNIR